jgi:hypothetical protein
VLTLRIIHGAVFHEHLIIRQVYRRLRTGLGSGHGMVFLSSEKDII